MRDGKAGGKVGRILASVAAAFGFVNRRPVGAEKTNATGRRGKRLVFAPLMAKRSRGAGDRGEAGSGWPGSLTGASSCRLWLGRRMSSQREEWAVRVVALRSPVARALLDAELETRRAGAR